MTQVQGKIDDHSLAPEGPGPNAQVVQFRARIEEALRQRKESLEGTPPRADAGPAKRDPPPPGSAPLIPGGNGGAPTGGGGRGGGGGGGSPPLHRRSSEAEIRVVPGRGLSKSR